MNNHLSDHLGVNAAVVRVRAGFGEGVRILIIGVQGLGLKESVITGDHVRYVVLIQPSDCTVRRTVSVSGPKVKLSTLTSVAEALDASLLARVGYKANAATIASGSATVELIRSSFLLIFFSPYD